MEERIKRLSENPLLLIIDMQNVYSKNQKWECENYDSALERIMHLIDVSLGYSGDMIFTRYIADNSPSGVWKDYNLENADINADKWLNEIDARLQLSYGNIKCYDKSVYSAYSVEEIRVAASKASCVIVTGVVAECCVLSTVMSFIDAGIYVFYITDAIAGIDEEKEKATIKVLEGLAPLHLSIMTSSEFVALMNRK